MVFVMESLISISSSSSSIDRFTSLSHHSKLNLFSTSSSSCSRFSSNSRSIRRKRLNIQKFSIYCCNKSLNSIEISKFKLLDSLNSSNSVKLDKSLSFRCEEDNVFNCIRNSIVLTVFCIVVSFFPVKLLQKPAIAIPFVGLLSREKKETKEESKWKEHEFAGYTKRLLETVSVLLKSIEDVRSSKGNMNDVKKALKVVELKKSEFQEEIRSALNAELEVMVKERKALVKRSEEIVDLVSTYQSEHEKLLKNVREGDEVDNGPIERLEEKMNVAEKEYDEIWEKVGEIEDKILRRETLSFSVGIRELCFIERESQLLVENFNHEIKHRNISSVPTSSTTMHSKSDIQRELEVAQREYWEKMLLPRVLEVEESGIPLDQNTKNFVVNIKQGFEESRELQRKVEAGIRQKMKRYGNERRFLLKTPEDEVVKGYPEAELKWVFGNKEVAVPKAIRLHLFHGWKKWQEEAKAELKQNLLQNVDQGKQYVAQIQERILVDRDRVVAKTWFNEERNRWEMDPLAVPYAVTKKLVENVRIRHDWGAMYVALKGEDKEYYVDIQELDVLFEDFGGFDGLYLKMLASGIPTAVQLMLIPFSELDIRQQFLVTTRFTYQWLVRLWKLEKVSEKRELFCEIFQNTSDDIMVMIVFPIMDSIIPYPIRMRLGMAWPEWADQSVGSTWYLEWQSEAEINFKSRKDDSFLWHLWFFIRAFIYGYVLLNVLCYMKKKAPRVLGYGRIQRDPNLRKLWRVKAYRKFKKQRKRRRIKAGTDPIPSAFDRMKRIKNPPIPLKEFASVDSMREEINEVVAFLQNPSAFREMGARAPRGVLIVGERGTGKTSLALAIAAEAKVPLVEVKSQQLEAGLWVGQSASNVRELFQTARDLAPVIIFVEDFDLFAGVRGKFIHTQNQDHEAFINQLLVELDGFEKQDGVVLMATTRNVKQIDPALRRPGRMDRVFNLQRPTQMEREKILQISAKETMDDELIDFVDWSKVAEKTALLRPIELKLVPVALECSAFRSKFLDIDELMSYSGWFATFSGIVPGLLRRTKVMKGIAKWLVNHLGLTLTKEDLQSVVDLMEPYGQISNGIELLNPPLDGIGCTKFTNANEGSANGNIDTRSYLEKKLVFCFGSLVASQMLLPFGEDNFLSSSEIKKAQEIATRMVIQYGWGPDDSPAIYISSNAVTALSMGNNHEYEIAAKVERMYNLAYDKAKDMLQQNRQVLEKIVEELLELEMLSGKDLGRILEENGGILEKEPFFLSSFCCKELPSGGSPDGENASGLALLNATNS
ncbi:hypothetical protein AQUCO_00300576v1 [Aquilegia coerulea]|uniref:AAA+ ATPase domain-containing protein n=1 Tax=Aquilegia coerulea TaxID=218851 RepID=A0A2G5EZG6_AQUCA|nr:hypothetical protein AQUCO_00300576v1 [Aquilegia coerulea]